MTVRPTRFYSNKQEKKVAKQVGGHKVANSGAVSYTHLTLPTMAVV